MALTAKSRSLPFNAKTAIVLGKGNRSTHYAGEWLNLLGNPDQTDTQAAEIIITAGDPKRDVADDYPEAGAVIRLWDFQARHAALQGRAVRADDQSSTMLPGKVPG